MRQNEALSIEDKRRIHIEAAEAERLASIKEVEAERTRQNDLRRQEFKKIAFEKKMEKRGGKALIT